MYITRYKNKWKILNDNCNNKLAKTFYTVFHIKYSPSNWARK